jgi:hypothetical protein
LASLSGFVFSLLFQASLELPSKTKPATCMTGFYVVGDYGLTSSSRFRGPLQHKIRRSAFGIAFRLCFFTPFPGSLEPPSKTKPATCVTGFYVVGDYGFEPQTLCL